MNANEPTEVEGTDLEPRDARALTECMTVLPEGGDVYTVVGENGSSYAVDSRDGRCTCPDHEHRGATCKHLRRVAYATGERAIPAWVESDGVDELLGEHTEATTHVAAADGGMIVAGDDGEILDEGGDDEGERPEGCACDGLHERAELPCWPCFRAGFETPASAE